MKIKIISTAFILIIVVISTNLKAQNSPTHYPTNSIKSDDVYLNYGAKHIKIADITPSATVKLFGKPDQIKKGDGTQGLDVGDIAYHYFNGEIIFKDDKLIDINILNPGWTFTFLINNKMSEPFTNNTPLAKLKTLFPISFANKRSNLVHIFLKTISGKATDTSITFDVEADHIRYAYLFGDES